jgi:Flp pilus assembly protein protease CpaA
MIPLRLYTMVVGGAGVLLVAYFLLRRKPKTAEDLERERRAWLDQVGRITDGTLRRS